MNKRLHRLSLSTRLLLAVLLAVVLALTVASLATRAALRSFLVARVDTGLSASSEAMSHQLDEHGGDGRGRDGRGGDPGRVGTPENTFVQIRDASGAVEVASIVGSTPGLDNRPNLALVGDNSLGYRTVPSLRDGAAPMRIQRSTLIDGRQLIVAVSLRDEESTLRRLGNIELGVALAALGIAMAGGWGFVRLGLRPLREVERTATAIANGELDRRVPGESIHTELGRLATTFNSMLNRIQEAFALRDAKELELRRSEERMRRFVGDASHELRTPLAAVSAYAELFTLGAKQRPQDLERTMIGIRKETSRMGSLVQDLLALARLDDGQTMEQRPVELVSIMAESVNAANLIDPAWPVKLIAPQPIDCVGDALRIRQVIDNLLANVRAHTPRGSETEVTLSRMGDTATIIVTDTGPGISEDQARRIFERFYRIDPSRSRRSGGAGLGLSIVEAIVGAHGGRIHVESALGRGTSFVIELPLHAQCALPP